MNPRLTRFEVDYRTCAGSVAFRRPSLSWSGVVLAGPCATIERCVSAIVGVTRLKQSQAWGARTGLPSDVMDTLHMHSDARCWMSSNPLLRRHGSRACPPDGRPGRMWCGKCSELEKIAKHGILCSAGHAVAPSRAGVRRWEMVRRRHPLRGRSEFEQ